jgi:O-antigen/teichoic acid export membrane protein
VSTVLPAAPPRQNQKPCQEADQRPAHGIANPQNGSATGRALTFLRSMGVRDSLVMAVAMALAGGLDYGVNILAGRWLVPTEYGVFIAVAALLQVLTQLTNSIRNVVAFYTAELTLKQDASQGVGAFVRRVWRWGWRWGLLATAAMAVISPTLARALRIPNAWPVLAATPVMLLCFTRTVTDGALQGLQSFGGFGMVQIAQSLLRLLFAAALIWAGWQAAGAILALPIAMAVVLVLAVWLLRPYFRGQGEGVGREVSWHYSTHTLMGLAAFALLANMDALFVKHFYSPSLAGNYGPVVTLEKISLFLPMALGIVLLPKATRRCASGRDPRPILLLALAATLLPGLFLTGLYALFPGWVVRTIFTGAYSNPGIVLSLANLAATLYAGLFIWLNYALSLNRLSFIYSLAGVVVLQGLAMSFFGRDSLVHMTLVMVLAGLAGNLAGFVTTWSNIAASDAGILPTT